MNKDKRVMVCELPARGSSRNNCDDIDEIVQEMQQRSELIMSKLRSVMKSQSDNSTPTV